MQFRQFFSLTTPIFGLIITIGIVFFGVGSLAAQQITTNENGERIIVYPDGTWRYVDGAKPNELSETIDAQSVEENEVTEQERLAMEAAERRAAEEAEAMRLEAAAEDAYENAKEELEEAETYDDLSKSEMSELKGRVKEAKKALKRARESRKDTQKRLAKAEKQLQNYAEQPATTEPERVVSPTPAQTVELSNASINRDSDKRFARFDPSMDARLNPPDPKCELAFDGVDDFSGKKRRDVASQFFFSYTNDDLRAYYKERDFISCEAYLSSLTGGFKFLTLTLTIASETAQRSYGIIEKGSIIHIKLLNGNTVKMFNNKTDIGKVDPLDKSTTYVAQYIISSSDEKQLKKSEVDKVRMIWSTGYEDYEVYELDFFKNQFECLNQ